MEIMPQLLDFEIILSSMISIFLYVIIYAPGWLLIITWLENIIGIRMGKIKMKEKISILNKELKLRIVRYYFHRPILNLHD